MQAISIAAEGPNLIESPLPVQTLPNSLTATINHERSPVLLTEEAEFTAWLNGTPEEAFCLIKTSDPERMHIIQSGLGKENRAQ